MFRMHAEHEFWLYYALPGFALTIPEVVRLLFPRAWMRLAAIMLVVGWSAFGFLRWSERWRSTLDLAAAVELDRLASRPTDILITDRRLSVASFYVRHWCVASAAPHAKQLEIHRLKKSGRIRPGIVFLVADAPEAPLPAAADLRVHGQAERLEPDEVARRMPAVARILQGAAVGIVRVD